jgi:hypothetical protein
VQLRTTCLAPAIGLHYARRSEILRKEDHPLFKESLRYVAVRLFITRSDLGEPVVNYSGLLGALAAEALANAYYPPGSRGPGSTLTRYSADIGWRFGGNLLQCTIERGIAHLKLQADFASPLLTPAFAKP